MDSVAPCETESQHRPTPLCMGAKRTNYSYQLSTDTRASAQIPVNKPMKLSRTISTNHNVVFLERRFEGHCNRWWINECNQPAPSFSMGQRSNERNWPLTLGSWGIFPSAESMANYTCWGHQLNQDTIDVIITTGQRKVDFWNTIFLFFTWNSNAAGNLVEDLASNQHLHLFFCLILITKYWFFFILWTFSHLACA